MPLVLEILTFCFFSVSIHSKHCANHFNPPGMCVRSGGGSHSPLDHVFTKNPLFKLQKSLMVAFVVALYKLMDLTLRSTQILWI